MADPQANVNMTHAQLQSLLEGIAQKMKEPTEMEKAKMEQERIDTVRRAKEQADLAKTEEMRKRQKWNGCPHYEIYNGRRFNKWGGQVNSDGFVRPVCNICHVEAPPFSAKLLPDEGRQGVNFEQWNDASKDALISLHKQTFPKGCDRPSCYVCAEKKVA